MTIYSHKFTGALPAGDVFSFGWHSSTGISLAASHANAVAWENDFWNGLVGFNTIITSGVVMQKITSYQLDVAFPYKTVAVASTDVTDPGTSGGDSLPQDVSEVVSLRSADPSRKGRGRMYLPAVYAGGLSTNGELSSLAQATILGALTSAWTASRAGGDNPVVFSRTTGLTQQILQFGVATVFDRQVRRVNKVATLRTFDPMP